MDLGLWLKLVKRFRAPFVLLLDRDYSRASLGQLIGFCKEIRPLIPEWAADTSDCDDAAFILKGEASKRKHQWIGLAWGWFGPKFWQLHMRNIALLVDDETLVEPQTMAIDPNDGFHSIVILI